MNELLQVFISKDVLLEFEMRTIKRKSTEDPTWEHSQRLKRRKIDTLGASDAKAQWVHTNEALFGRNIQGYRHVHLMHG